MTRVKHENRVFSKMAVPISGAKMVHHQTLSKPQPIIVEKLKGQHVIPSCPFQGLNTQAIQQGQLGIHGGGSGSCHKDSLCYGDTMSQALTLAKMDVKRKKHNADVSPLVPSKTKDNALKVHKLKTKKPSVKVHEVNSKFPKHANVHYSRLPERPKTPETTPISKLPVTTNSPPTHDKESCNQMVQQILGDIGKQLTELRDFFENLLKELNDPNPAVPEEEEEARAQKQEQGTLKVLTRQVYVVQQQIVDIERKLNSMHNYKTITNVNISKLGWTKSRLISAYRGAYKSLQVMRNSLKRYASPFTDIVFQLKLADLLSQLLEHLRRLIDLYLQLKCLFYKSSSHCHEVLELVDLVDALQAEWQCHLEGKLRQHISSTARSSTSLGSQKKSPASLRKDISRKPSQKNIQLKISPGDLKTVTPEKKSSLEKPTCTSKPCKSGHKMIKKFSGKKRKKSVISHSRTKVGQSPGSVSIKNKRNRPTSSSHLKSPHEEKPMGMHFNSSQSSPVTVASIRKPSSMPIFDNKSLGCQPAHRVVRTGKSFIEELLTFESERQQISSEAQESERVQEKKSLADLHLEDQVLSTVDLNLPPIEALLHRLTEMESEQNQIRSRWASVIYHDTEAVAEECGKVKVLDSTDNFKPHSVSPIIFSKKANTKNDIEIIQEQPQKSVCGELPGAIRFTKSESKRNCRERRLERIEEVPVYENPSLHQYSSLPPHQTQPQPQSKSNPPSGKPRQLFMSNKILKNIVDNRQRFTTYLVNSAYHQVESFDPWHLTEELADSVLDDCLEDVSKEMQDLSFDLVHYLFDNEFVELHPPPTSND